MLGSVFAALVAALLAGCAPTEGMVESGIKRELPRLVGPADGYDVNIQGLNARSGQAQRLRAVGTRVRPEKAPVLDRVEVDLRDVTYDRGQKQLEKVGDARTAARVTAADLADFLEKQRSVQDVSLDLQYPDRVTIRARPEIRGVNVPGGATLEVAGRLVPAGSAVNFDIREVRAAGVGLGGTVARTLSQALNPLVDLSGLPLVLQVQDVRAQDGAVVLTATGSYPRRDGAAK